MPDISPRLLAYLKLWFATSTGRQAEAGVVVELTFDQFLALFKPRQLASLQKAIDNNRLRYLQAELNQKGEPNQFAFVLTWRSYAARSSNVLSLETAIVCCRRISAKLSLPKKGDTLRQSHRSSLSKARKGVPKSERHRAAIAAGVRGTNQTPEQIAKRTASRLATLAAKRAPRPFNSGAEVL